MSEHKPNQIDTTQVQEQQASNISGTEATAPPLSPPPKGNVDILKEAFPETDTEVIEAVLQAQNDNIESSFEMLLGMSDPSYKAAEATPPMPPRPQSEAPYAYWQRQEQQHTEQPISVEEQMRLDEAYAKQLFEEDRRHSEQRKSFIESKEIAYTCVLTILIKDVSNSTKVSSTITKITKRTHCLISKVKKKGE